MSKIKQFIKVEAEGQTQLRGERPRNASWAYSRWQNRVTLRAAHLLYAFTRGVPYAKLERRVAEPPPLSYATRLSRELCDAPIEEGALKAWATAAT